MKDVVEINIDAPIAMVARLFANPGNSEKWMDDSRYEPLSGDQGAPGSTYRLVSRNGKMVFTATVIARDLPNESELVLEAPNVVVRVRSTFAAIAPDKTKLISEEIFSFKGLFNKLFGLLARHSIRSAHRHHMESFKRFAEKTR
jgi:hypothetical protein